MSSATPQPQRPLGPGRKAGYALGELAAYSVSNSLLLVYTAVFLKQVAGLTISQAGTVVFLGRIVDAVMDPVIGLWSDRARWRFGRRRPFFLAAIPFALLYVVLWTPVGIAEAWARTGYYAAIWALLSISMTLLTVPYQALLREMTRGSKERSSLNTWTYLGNLLSLGVAITLPEFAPRGQDDTPDFLPVVLPIAAGVVLCWLIVYLVTFERPPSTPSQTGGNKQLLQDLTRVRRHGSFQRLAMIYSSSRVAVDATQGLMLLYMTHWLNREGDFDGVMITFIAAVLVSIALWSFVGRNRDRATVIQLGSWVWLPASIAFYFLTPESPPLLLFIVAAWVGIGLCAVDKEPRPMLADVIDEFDLQTGQRLEGAFNGCFTMIRKCAGAAGFWLACLALDLVGVDTHRPEESAAAANASGAAFVPEPAYAAVLAFFPAAAIALTIFLCRGYSLTRARIGEIHQALEARSCDRPESQQQ